MLNTSPRTTRVLRPYLTMTESNRHDNEGEDDSRATRREGLLLSKLAPRQQEWRAFRRVLGQFDGGLPPLSLGWSLAIVLREDMGT